jgi:hypothetical protein
MYKIVDMLQEGGYLRDRDIYGKIILKWFHLTHLMFYFLVQTLYIFKWSVFLYFLNKS